MTGDDRQRIHTCHAECPCHSGGEPVPDFMEDSIQCSHCGGEGLCWDGSDPLGDCPDDPHRCHACGGSGRGKDQVIF